MKLFGSFIKHGHFSADFQIIGAFFKELCRNNGFYYIIALAALFERMHRPRRKKARLTFFERQFSLGIPEVLGTLAGQDIDKFIERVTVIIWLLAGGMLSHMKFVGFSCRDKRLTVCVERLERFFIEARRYYFIRLFKLFGYHLPYSSFR